uniref:Uncharacterized protein n=1 Tax=Anopheles coluzzii TaxID=1518534 RepID=A0A8W7PT57_ANOCL
MASLSISILDSFLSGGSVGSNFLSSENATLNASTRIRSRVACAVRYLRVARRRLRRSSRVRKFGGLNRGWILLLLALSYWAGTAVDWRLAGGKMIVARCAQLGALCSWFTHAYGTRRKFHRVLHLVDHLQGEKSDLL